MSMYGMLFGNNPLSDLILATLDLTRDSVGRFRDCFVTDGKIAVYTRNGGGNRNCWHEGDSSEYGSVECRNEPYAKEVRETVRLPGSVSECGCNGGPTYLGKVTEHDHPTGRMVTETWHRCLAPDSAECACPGCIIVHHLPHHPHYLYDRDDEFDSTYATVYFRFPPEWEADLKRLDSGERFDPDARWLAKLDAIQSAVSS